MGLPRNAIRCSGEFLSLEEKTLKLLHSQRNCVSILDAGKHFERATDLPKSKFLSWADSPLQSLVGAFAAFARRPNEPVATFSFLFLSPSILKFALGRRRRS